MTQKGDHTWDLIFHYHQCPKCSFIIECRKNYENRLGKFEKEVECARCQAIFTVQQKIKPSFGPLFGDQEPIEFTWNR